MQSHHAQRPGETVTVRWTPGYRSWIISNEMADTCTGQAAADPPVPPATKQRPMVLDGATRCSVHSIVQLGHPMKNFWRN